MYLLGRLKCIMKILLSDIYTESTPNYACYVHTTTKAPDPIRTRKLNVVGLD